MTHKIKVPGEISLLGNHSGGGVGQLLAGQSMSEKDYRGSHASEFHLISPEAMSQGISSPCFNICPYCLGGLVT
jgi:hypothetical protein